MSVNRSVEFFKSRTMNCAEAILRGFQGSLGVSERILAEAKSLGGGRTPEGRCGALHAALMLADNPTAREKVRSHFVAVVGSESCREIRKKRTVSCVKCVEAAAQILQREMERKDDAQNNEVEK